MEATKYKYELTGIFNDIFNESKDLTELYSELEAIEQILEDCKDVREEELENE